MKPSINAKRAVLASALAAALLLAAPAYAADPPAKPGSGASLDDLLEITGADGKKPQPAPRPNDNAGPELDAQARKALEREEADAADAFKKAVKEMYQVSEKIGRDIDTSRDVQRDQEEIVKKLDQVIETAEKCQCNGSKPGSGKPKEKKQNGSQKNQQQGKKPSEMKSASSSASGANASGAPNVTGGLGITTPLAELRERWGNLPGRVREQLMQGVQEKVSPVYREWTEQYYKRLAEEQQ